MGRLRQSGSWVKLLVHFLQSGLIYVSVDLSCLDASVPEHLLDEPEIGTAGQ